MFFSISLFSQGNLRLSPIIPETSSSANDLEKKIESEVEIIKNSGYFTFIKRYLMVRNENFSLCDSTDKDCRDSVRSLLFIRYLSEGRCGKINDSRNRDFCLAVKANNCNSLSGWRRDFCEGLIKEDIRMLMKATNSNDCVKDTGGGMDKAGILEFMGIYAGFKYYSSLSCEKFLKRSEVPLYRRIACRIIFSSDYDSRINRILRDLAIFRLSRKEHDYDLCNLIESNDMKKACLDYRIKTLDEIW